MENHKVCFSGACTGRRQKNITLTLWTAAGRLHEGNDMSLVDVPVAYRGNRFDGIIRYRYRAASERDKGESMSSTLALDKVNELGFYEMRFESVGGLGANLAGQVLAEGVVKGQG